MDQLLSHFVFIFYQFVMLLVDNQILTLSRELNAIDDVVLYALAQNVGVVDGQLIEDVCFLFEGKLVHLDLRSRELVLIESLFLDGLD